MRAPGKPKPPAPSANAIRQRLYRQRRDADRAVLRVEVAKFAVADALVAAGMLAEWDADDREKIEAALSRVVEVWVAGARYA